MFFYLFLLYYFLNLFRRNSQLKIIIKNKDDNINKA